MRRFLTTFASCFVRDTTFCCSISLPNHHLERDKDEQTILLLEFVHKRRFLHEVV